MLVLGYFVVGFLFFFGGVWFLGCLFSGFRPCPKDFWKGVLKKRKFFVFPLGLKSLGPEVKELAHSLHFFIGSNLECECGLPQKPCCASCKTFTGMFMFSRFYVALNLQIASIRSYLRL